MENARTSASNFQANYWYHDIEECDCCLDFWLGPQSTTNNKKAIDGDSDCDSGYGSMTPHVETTQRDSFVIPTITITPLTDDEMILHNACVRAAYAHRNMFMESYSTSSPAYTSPYTNDDDNNPANTTPPSSLYRYSSSSPSSPASSSASISTWSFTSKSRRTSFSSSTTSIAALPDRLPLFPHPTLRPPQEGPTCRIKDTFENRTAWPSFFEEPYTTTPYASSHSRYALFDDEEYDEGSEEESIYAGIYRGIGKRRRGSTTSLGSLRSVASVKQQQQQQQEGGGGAAAMGVKVNGPLFGVGGKRLKKKRSSSSLLVDEVHPCALSVVRGLTRPERTAKPKVFVGRTSGIASPTTMTMATPRMLVKAPPPMPTTSTISTTPMSGGSGENGASSGPPRGVRSVNTTTTTPPLNRWSFTGSPTTSSGPATPTLGGVGGGDGVIYKRQQQAISGATPPTSSPTPTSSLPRPSQLPVRQPAPSTVSPSTRTVTANSPSFSSTPSTSTISNNAGLASAPSGRAPPSVPVPVPGSGSARGRQMSTSSTSSSTSSDATTPAVPRPIAIKATVPTSTRRLASATTNDKRLSVEGSGWSWTGRFGGAGNSSSSSGGGSGGTGGNVYSDTTSWSISSAAARQSSSSLTKKTTGNHHEPHASVQPKPSSSRPLPPKPSSDPHSSLRATASAVFLPATSSSQHSRPHNPSLSSLSSTHTPTPVSTSSFSSSFTSRSRSTTSLASISLNTPLSALSSFSPSSSSGGKMLGLGALSKRASASSTSLATTKSSSNGGGGIGGSKFGRGLRNLVGGLYSTAPSAFRL